MTEAQKMNRAREVLASIENTLSSLNWDYSRGNTGFKILTKGGLEKDVWECDVEIIVYPDMQVVHMVFEPPFSTILKSKPTEACLAVCAANGNMADGRFGFGLESGVLYYCSTYQYCDRVPGQVLIESMITTGLNEVSAYLEDFRNISNGRLSIQTFVERESRK